MYQLMVNRKNSKKGFTLVEVIVVLVILAILAAIMIPAMTGWIDEAKNKQVFVEARTALLAAQTIVSEEWTGTAPTAARTFSSGEGGDAKYIALVGSKIGNLNVPAGGFAADGQIVSATYTAKDTAKGSATWNGTTWEKATATNDD